MQDGPISYGRTRETGATPVLLSACMPRNTLRIIRIIPNRFILHYKRISWNLWIYPTRYSGSLTWRLCIRGMFRTSRLKTAGLVYAGSTKLTPFLMNEMRMEDSLSYSSEVRRTRSTGMLYGSMIRMRAGFTRFLRCNEL